MTPNECEQNPLKLRILNEDYRAKMRPKYTIQNRRSKKFNIGDQVRILIERTKFHRNYLQNFTEEIFIIDKKLTGLPITLFALRDFNGNALEGRWYAKELIKVSPHM